MMDKDHKAIQVRKSDYEYLDKLRKTPNGNIPYAEIFHIIVERDKESRV